MSQVLRPIHKSAVGSGRQAQGRIRKAREVVALWRFHLKRQRIRLPIPYSLPWRFHLKRWRRLNSTPKIPFWSRMPTNEKFSPAAHSN